MNEDELSTCFRIEEQHNWDPSLPRSHGERLPGVVGQCDCRGRFSEECVVRHPVIDVGGRRLGSKDHTRGRGVYILQVRRSRGPRR